MNINLSEEKYIILKSALLYEKIAYQSKYYDDSKNNDEELNAIESVLKKILEKKYCHYSLYDAVTIILALKNFQNELLDNNELLKKISIDISPARKINILKNLIKEYESIFSNQGLDINDYIE